MWCLILAIVLVPVFTYSAEKAQKKKLREPGSQQRRNARALNPVEYLWGHWKHHELPNFCPKTFAALGLSCCSGSQTHASPLKTDHGFLETSGIVLTEI